jgi:hypothetical protein
MHGPAKSQWGDVPHAPQTESTGRSGQPLTIGYFILVVRLPDKEYWDVIRERFVRRKARGGAIPV